MQLKMKQILYVVLLALTTAGEKHKLGCLLFDSNEDCRKCKKGYVLVNNDCIALSYQITKEEENFSPSEIDPVDRCIIPLNDGSCAECTETFLLYNEQCVLSACEMFKGCLYCEYKYCLKCKEGFDMISSICKPEETMTNTRIVVILASMLSTVIGLNLVTIGIIIIKRLLKKKKKKLPIEVPKIVINNIKEEEAINQKNKPFDLNRGNISFNASNDNIIATSLHYKQGIDLPCNTIQLSLTKKCIVCDSAKVYVILNCGCELCFSHYLEYIKQPSSLKVCNIHKVKLIHSYIVQSLTDLDSNPTDILNLNNSLKFKLCPICKISTGIISINCGCNSRLCDKCFKDIIQMVNYYQCPSCQAIV